MVQELDWVHLNPPRRSRTSRRGQTISHSIHELKYLPDAAIPILFRMSAQDKPVEKDSKDESLEFTPAIKEACYFLADQVKSLRKNAQKLEEIDPLTAEVTKQLDIYCKGIIFESLGNGAGFRVNPQNQYLSLNSNTIFKLAQGICCKVPEKSAGNFIGAALTIFLCHEISHISQGVKHYEDVQRMKSVSESYGRARMGELDLRSDFLAANILSHNFVLQNKKSSNQRAYIRYFYEIWCNVCKVIVETFPTSNQKDNNRKDKQQRMFGYLLMSNLARYAYESNHPLEFNAELWPVWSDSLDQLAFFSGGNPFFPGSCVNPAIMRQILDDISKGKNDSASLKIEEIWKRYPRR